MIQCRKNWQKCKERKCEESLLKNLKRYGSTLLMTKAALLRAEMFNNQAAQLALKETIRHVYQTLRTLRGVE